MFVLSVSSPCYGGINLGGAVAEVAIDYTQVAYCESAWLLNESTNTDSAVDATSNSRDLDDTGTPEPATGKFGGGRVTVDADNAYFWKDPLSTSFTGSDSILVMGWCKANSTNGSILTMEAEILLRVDSNKAQFILNSFSSNDRVSGATDVNDNAWHHVAGFWDGTNIYVYVDGSDDSSGGLATSGTWAGASSDRWDIGTFGGTQFNASLDEIAVFSNTDSGISTKAKIEQIISDAYNLGLEGNG